MKKLSIVSLIIGAFMISSCQCSQKQTPPETEADSTTVSETPNNDTIEVNNMFTDFIMNDTEGNPISISDEIAKHKITIIDFWASWCGPCRAEMPNLVSLYAQQKDKGLGIIGISLDNDMEAWKDAIINDGITWLQLSDLQGWDNAAAKMFNVSFIPYTIIVDANGSILAEGLRGEDLDNFIKTKL